MEFPEGFNQLELLESHGHMIPVGTESAWEEEDGDDDDEEDEEGEPRGEEWYQTQEHKLHNHPTQLMLWAAEKNRLSTVQRLLTSDPSLATCRDEDGYTPLHRASYGGHVSVASALLDAGAELEARTADGWTPLHSACRWGRAAAASLLLRRGARINAATAGKLTPLHLAAANANAAHAIQLLLAQRSLLPALRNSAGETAYDIALRTSGNYCLFEITEPCNNVV